MKRLRYLWLLAALFAVSTANAQFRFGAKGGVNIANAKFNRDVFKSDNVTGFHLGPTVEGMFGQGGIGMDMALLFSRKGFDTDLDKVKNDFIEIPVNVKFKLGMPLVNPYLAAGPYIAFRVAGDKIWDVGSNTTGIVDQVRAQNFGAGLNFSAGAELFDRLQIGLTYSWGLTDNYKTFEKNNLDSYKGKLQTWVVSAVIFF